MGHELKIPQNSPTEIFDLPVLICQIDEMGNFIWANRIFSETFLNQIGVNDFFDIIPGNIISSLSLQGRKEFSIKTPATNIHGRYQVLMFHFTPIDSPQGLRFTVITTDVSELERVKKTKDLLLKLVSAEKESKDLNSFYNSIQQHLNSIMDANNLFIILWEKALQTFNLTYFVDEKDKFNSFPSGKTLSSFAIESGKSLLVTEKDILRMESEGLAEIIGSLPKAWMGVPLRNNSEITGLLVIQSYKSEEAYTKDDLQILEFISNQIAISIERKQYESTLRMAKTKAEEADKLKSSFLANMSHEIRTPMNSIIGFSELIARKTIAPEKKDIYAQYITNSSKSLLNLIDDIIDISKIEAKQLSINKSTTNINLMIQELFDFYETHIEKSNLTNLELVKQVAVSDKNFNIHCDYLRVKQVLNNLLNNAIKFTTSGFVEFGYIIPNNATILFYVQDTGIGMAPDKLDLIFEPFRQADDSTTRKYGGTGLGLAISKKLAQLMGGRIWVDSELGKGTTFYFSLPLIIPSTSESYVKSPYERITSHRLKGKTILIAEDEDINFFFLQEVLSPTQAKIIRATNGQEAVNEILNNPKISLVLMDIQMPVLNGYEATQQIKRINPSIPVIAQTAYAMAEDRAKGLRAGCNDYLSKPIKPEQLLDMVKQYLGKKV